MKKIGKYLLIVFGACILSFGVYNVHAQSGIAEGGELGLELLFKHFFNISPAITSLVFDFTFFVLGIFIIKNKFAIKACIGSVVYSISYYIWECFNPVLPSFENNLLLGCIIGAFFVGIGSGIVVKLGGASGGDDSLALILNKITKMPISVCYFLFDFVIILLSMSYIAMTSIVYSFITAFISSIIIDLLQKVNLKSFMNRLKQIGKRISSNGI